MQTKIIKVGVLALSLAMLGGCADMKKMQADIQANSAAAAAAMSKANDAHSLAQHQTLHLLLQARKHQLTRLQHVVKQILTKLIVCLKKQ
mgnify:CR=1 FL=1